MNFFKCAFLAVSVLMIQLVTAQVTRYSKPAELDLQDTHVPLDYEFHRGILEEKQRQYNEQIEYDKQKAQTQMQQIRSYYATFSSYPEKISDGWHSIIAMNNFDFCGERKVFVSENKITKYLNGNSEEISIAFSGPINQCKGLIQIKFSDGTTDFLDIYFLEYLKGGTN